MAEFCIGDPHDDCSVSVRLLSADEEIPELLRTEPGGDNDEPVVEPGELRVVMLIPFASW